MTGAAHESKTRLLDAALRVIRAKGYSATRVEDVCTAAGLTKGSFFHHFKGKEDLALAAAEHWSTTTGALFRAAPYHRHADPLQRLLGDLEFRKELLRGEPAEVTCLAGTMVQETFETHPAIRDACGRSIADHAVTLEADIAAAMRERNLTPDWTAKSLALHTQAVLQGAFILAKAQCGAAGGEAGAGAAIAADSIDHLTRYLELLFGVENAGRPS